MKTADRKHYLSKEEYKESIEILIVYSTMILFAFTTHSEKKRDTIIRNFIARGIGILKSIQAVWELRQYEDGWILYRSLIDRLFHLVSLSKDNAFDVFDEWSFIQQYEMRNKIRSDPKFKGTLNPEYFSDTEEEKKRYNELKRRNPKWKRPKPEKIAEAMNLEFLYKYGYDYASTFVHPMSNDGDMDFLRLTALNKYEEPLDQRVLLHNSCLTVVLLIQEGLNNSKLKWINLVYKFLDDFINLLKSGSIEYKNSFLKIVKIIEENKELCQNSYIKK